MYWEIVKDHMQEVSEHGKLYPMASHVFFVIIAFRASIYIGM